MNRWIQKWIWCRNHYYLFKIYLTFSLESMCLNYVFVFNRFTSSFWAVYFNCESVLNTDSPLFIAFFQSKKNVGGDILSERHVCLACLWEIVSTILWKSSLIHGDYKRLEGFWVHWRAQDPGLANENIPSFNPRDLSRACWIKSSLKPPQAIWKSEFPFL